MAGKEFTIPRLSGNPRIPLATRLGWIRMIRRSWTANREQTQVAVQHSSRQDRLNIHGAIDLETGQTRMLDVLVVDAASTIMLLTAIEAMHPRLRLIHVRLNNPRHHHAEAGATLADQDRLPHPAPLHCDLLSASQSDRTNIGINAQARQP